ncbi:MAG TPA: tetratricopeptide repeat protein [Bacteroidia bacterium]|jgi:tetratricopeptide (TPR) repeat protein|nr:tetratricopeptide repeat protein [Bacteroidia bacterium]
MRLIYSSCCLLIGGFILLSACRNGTNQAQQTVQRKDSATVKTVDTITPKINLLSQRIAADPKDHNSYWMRGVMENAQKKYGPALSDYEQAIKLDSTKAVYYYSLADVDFTIGHTRDAKDAFEKCISLDPKNTDALLRLAELYFYVKKYPEAFDYVNRTLKVNKYLGKAYFLKGMIYLETKDTVKAISSMQTAVEQDTKYYDAYIQLGLLFTRKGNPLALDYFNDAINLRPNQIEAYYDKGMFYQLGQDYDNAIKTYREILQIDSTYKYVLYNLGFIYFTYNPDYKQSIVYFDKAIRKDSNYTMAYFGRGNCYEQLGQPERALLDYSHAVYLNPGFSAAQQSYKELKAKLHK